MYDPRVLTVVCTVLLLAAPPARPAEMEQVPVSVRMDGVAAYVNNATITLSDVIRSNRRLQSMFASGVSSAELNAAYREALEQMVAAELVVTAYEAQKKLQIPDAAIEERISAIVDGQFAGDRVALAEALAQEGLTLEGWRKQIREGIILQAMRSQYVERNVRVSPADVKAAFAARRSELSKPARARVAMIVVPVEDEGTATLATLRTRITAGEAFADLARESSTDAYAANGGERGWMELTDLRDELRTAVQGLSPGQVSDVVVAGSKAYLILLEEFVPEQGADFDSAAPFLERELRAEAAGKLFHEWIESLRRTSYVRVVEEAPF